MTPITYTAANDCGNIATSSIQVYPFSATTNSTSTYSGLNNGKANVSSLTGGRIELTFGLPECNQITFLNVHPDPNNPPPIYIEDRL